MIRTAFNEEQYRLLIAQNFLRHIPLSDGRQKRLAPTKEEFMPSDTRLNKQASDSVLR